MLLSDFTTFEEVRATLGVSDVELPDSTLLLALYATSLSIELRQVGSTLAADYQTIKAIPEGTRSAAQQDVFDAVNVFAPYAIAVQLASSLPLFSPKAVSDGKATMTRYSDSPYKVAIERCKAEYDRWKAYLVEKYGVFKPAAAVAFALPVFFRAASPDSNPVTGT